MQAWVQAWVQPVQAHPNSCQLACLLSDTVPLILVSVLAWLLRSSRQHAVASIQAACKAAQGATKNRGQIIASKLGSPQ